MSAAQQVNAEFPYEGIADNKCSHTKPCLMPSPLAIPYPFLLATAARAHRRSGTCWPGALLRSSFASHSLGSQARGIEILRRQDVEEYAARLESLERLDVLGDGSLPLELQGVPELLATWALRFDVSLLSELTLSKPLHCRRTGRQHHGCMRTILLIRNDAGGQTDVRFLGAIGVCPRAN